VIRRKCRCYSRFVDPEGGSQKATVVVVVLVVGISSLKIPKAFLIRKETLHTIRAHISYRSTVPDFQLT